MNTITIELIGHGAADKINGPEFGSVQLQVRVLDAEGATISGAPIAMTKPDGSKVEKTIDTNLTIGSTDFYTVFNYELEDDDEETLDFDSGDTTASITVP